MSSKYPGPGFNAVGEYQRSGIPFVTSSHGAEVVATAVTQIRFPRVTRWFQIVTSASSDTNAHLRIGFTANGVKGMGVITGSIQTGDFFQAGNNTSKPQQPVYVDVSPAPGAWQKSQYRGAEEVTSHGMKNYFVIPASSATDKVGTNTHRFELACTDLFLMAENGSTGFTLIAGLTNIQRNQLDLTGSAGFDGVG